jgi:peptidase M48-like protein
MASSTAHDGMGSRAQPPDDFMLGEWLHEALIDYCGVDEDAWAVELVSDIADRLNAARLPAPALEPVTLWVGEIAAFTGPGRYLYVTRGLLHRAWWKEATAFAVAHEMAHHDLGHTRILDGRLDWLRWLPGYLGLPIFLTLAGRWLNGPENETAADALALELCLAAGYDRARCLGLFDVIEAYALDHGDIEIVFGPLSVPDRPEGDFARWTASLREWAWRRARGYPSLRDRKAALLHQIGG